MEKILDDGYYDLIISNAVVPTYNTGDNITPLNEINSLLHLRKDSMEPCDLGEYPYHMFPALYTLESTICGNIPHMKAAQEVPEMGLGGRGVIIGIVDTGIDYQHPAFMYNDSTTRIISIWDQTKFGGTPPRGFTFGAEYTRELLNFALISDDPLAMVPTVDEVGHGTAIASIIAGRPNEEIGFAGVTPEADMVVVKLKEAKRNLKTLFSVPEDALCFQESDIILGIRYVVGVAQRLNRPLVICLAVGSSQGGHDGKGPSSMYLDYLVELPKTSVVVSAGNEANSRRHYYNNTETGPFYNSFQLTVGTNDRKFFMEIWPYIPSRLFIEITAPTFESSQVMDPSINGSCQKLTFQTVRTEVWINNIFFEEETGEQLILLRFQNAAPGTWYFRIGSVSDEPFSFHCWLPSGNLISNETFFPDSDPNTTITAQGDATNPLTVAAYNQQNGEILPESGRGYTRLGQVKPDISAPGYRIPCAIPENRYGTITGTGAAAAHTAGVAAMVMEWAYSKGNYTAVTGNQVNRLLVREAKRTQDETFPNQIWGYGILDDDEVFRRLLDL
ncbi:S8 family peptidase [Lacrimispora sp. JR3]|uniref:S8 family peptidase n=1 Tax=Lacrimispora sinapis TaxID=3111456 RepID=UPI003748BBC5